ncbi:unnamed protein product [Dracunculus medinensis]|uniref:Sodium/hydrogen exchanger n=1 Tax=Dracunculus medinensis TaxID=318479 RepID=A0A0N4U8P3_DRAME|nr:unnamed protein product [Dracunculus medinensis]
MLGAFISLVLSYSKRDWSEVESFSPNIFFLVLLPPIIFESGYNLHKGDFFANMFPILTFSIIGTTISAFTIACSLYILGQADLIYPLNFVECFIFGSLISAVDPVATLAIFQALNVEPLLYMLVFGESMLNDAVSIVLTSTALEIVQQPDPFAKTAGETLLAALYRFTYVFIVSALVGAIVGFFSALLFKYIDLRKTPALEFALLLVFAYLPYGLAETISLSGIMAILFCSITMSQYTHFNISPITQITMKQTLRALSFVAETCTFAYLGMALFTITLEFEPMFIFWSILLCIISRAFNVFPLSYLVNKCRETQISKKNQDTVLGLLYNDYFKYFKGMRGAVAFALALHISIEDDLTKRILLTTTLFIVLFTVVFLGGSALPLLKVLDEIFSDQERSKKKRRARRFREKRKIFKSHVLLSKTQEMALLEHSEMTSAAEDGSCIIATRRPSVKSNNFASRFNELFIRPIFVRNFTAQEKFENQMNLRCVTNEFFNEAENEFQFDQSSCDELFSHKSFINE